MNPHDITGIGMHLKVDDDLSLFGLLAADGSINRLGTGALNNTEKEMFIGITDPKLFQSLRAQITPDLLKWIGGRADQNLRGKVCELQIHLMLANRTEQSIFLKYGSDSMRPPPEVSQFVTAFVEVTSPWYEAQKSMGAKQT
jgi:hypothetical protein